MHLIYKYISIIILLFLSGNIWAIEIDTNFKTKPLRYDTNYIESKSDNIHLALIAVSQQTGIDLVNTKTDYRYRFVSNNPLRYGIGFDYEWLALEVTYAIPGFELNNKTQGDSETFAVKLGISGRKFRANAYYRSTKGFTHQNVEGLYPRWFLNDEYYPYLKNLRNRTLNVSVYYTFNHKKYSNKAALRPSERQLKSAGSPVLGILATMEGIYSPTPIVEADSLQNSYLNFKKAEYLKIGMNAGYMYTFSIKKKYYIHAALIPGLLYSYGDVLLHNEHEALFSNNLGGSIYSRFTAGYNGKTFYGGIFAVADIYASNILADRFATTSYTYLKFFVGYRFPIKKRKWMKYLFLD